MSRRRDRSLDRRFRCGRQIDEIGSMRGRDRIYGVMDGDVEDGELTRGLRRRDGLVSNRGQRLVVPICDNIAASLEETKKGGGDGEGADAKHSGLLASKAERVETANHRRKR
jgi:hypothetical protein